MVTINQPIALRLLREAVAASELTASDYAREILIREPRTLRRWLAGDSPIPDAVRDYLDRAQREHLERRLLSDVTT